MRSLVARAAGLWLVVLAAASCASAGQGPGAADSALPASPAQEPSPASLSSQSALPPGAAQAVRGTVTRRSDVATIPDAPVLSGRVIVVAPEDVPGLWAALGLPPTGPTAPAAVRGVIAASAVKAATAPVIDGDFQLEALPAADSVICLADVSAPADHLSIVGCVLLTERPVALHLVLGRGLLLADG